MLEIDPYVLTNFSELAMFSEIAKQEKSISVFVPNRISANALEKK